MYAVGTNSQVIPVIMNYQTTLIDRAIIMRAPVHTFSGRSFPGDLDAGTVGHDLLKKGQQGLVSL